VIVSQVGFVVVVSPVVVLPGSVAHGGGPPLVDGGEVALSPGNDLSPSGISLALGSVASLASSLTGVAASFLNHLVCGVVSHFSDLVASLDERGSRGDSNSSSEHDNKFSVHYFCFKL